MWQPIIFDVECIVCNKSLQKIEHNIKDDEEMGKITNNSNRRLRTPNWSFDEKQYLLELIKARKEVVITKSNNGPNYSEEKDIAWNEILRNLNVRYGSKFNGSSTKKVKTQWQNMKRIAREEIATNGAILFKLSKQSQEVCVILDMVKDGVLKLEPGFQTFNDSSLTTDVEVKTERIDEETNRPSCSGVQSSMVVDEQTNNDQENINTNQYETASSISEQISESNELDTDGNEKEDLVKITEDSIKKNVSIMTDATYCKEDDGGANPFHREISAYFKFTSAEKIMKMESLKEERQVIRAMRETAELNKIIAEQKLKHVLWVKKQEMA